MSNGYRSWWAHDLTKVGAWYVDNAQTGAGAGANTLATGQDIGSADKFLLCSAIDTQVNCNGRYMAAGFTEDGTDTTKLINRWV